MRGRVLGSTRGVDALGARADPRPKIFQNVLYFFDELVQIFSQSPRSATPKGCRGGQAVWAVDEEKHERREVLETMLESVLGVAMARFGIPGRTDARPQAPSPLNVGRLSSSSTSFLGERIMAKKARKAAKKTAKKAKKAKKK
jgi:hypothetical protein